MIRHTPGTTDASEPPAADAPAPIAASNEAAGQSAGSTATTPSAPAAAAEPDPDMGAVASGPSTNNTNDQSDSASGSQTQEPQSRPPIVENDTTKYVYCNANGVPKYCHSFRSDRSKHWSERWDGSKWVTGEGCMKGVRPLPYRLPELERLGGRYVYLFVK